MDNLVRKAAENFVEEIKRSDVYKQYEIQKEKLNRQPALFERVKEYRQRNFALQSSVQTEELLEKMEAFEREYEKFREDPLVDDFLRAELAFCRMMQEINVWITAELDFE